MILWEYTYSVYTKDMRSLVHAQHSCACSGPGNQGARAQKGRLSFMHKKSLVYKQKNILCIHKRFLGHAQHSCACSGPGNPGARAQKGRGPGLGPAQAPFLGPGPWVPWPRASTRVLCMHKRSHVYTQEILLCVHVVTKSQPRRNHVETASKPRQNHVETMLKPCRKPRQIPPNDMII